MGGAFIAWCIRRGETARGIPYAKNLLSCEDIWSNE